MSGTIKNTTALFILFSFIAGCSTQYAAFPELEGEGTLISDEQNIAYDDSSAETEKTFRKKTEKSVKAVEEKKVVEKKAKKAKDLTVPAPEVSEVAYDSESFVVPSKTTPVIINDMDLTEMDAADTKTKELKPDSRSTTIVPVKKERKTVAADNADKQEPSVFYLAETVYFNNGSSAVDSRYWGKLRKLVKEAKAHNGKIIVQGFASSRTRNTDIVTHKMANLKVSVARAENIAALLVKYGMPKNKVMTEGLSDSRPVYQEVMPEGERLNRRAEIYISY